MSLRNERRIGDRKKSSERRYRREGIEEKNGD